MADELRKQRLRIEGMHCAGCVAHVEKALRDVEGVIGASVNLVTQSAVVEFDSPVPPIRALQSAVQQAGYQAIPLVNPATAPMAASTAASTDVERRAAYDAPRLAQAEQLRRQRQALVLAIGLSAPILALDVVGHRLAGTQPGGHVGWRFIQAILSVMLLLSPAAGPMLVAGLRAMLRRSPTMDSLITVGVLASVVAGIASLFVADLNAFHFHAAAMILVFLNIGRYLEAKARHQTTDAMLEMTRRLPREAMLVTPGGLTRVAASQVAVGDRVQAGAHIVVPVDGDVEQGQGAIDESSITGESVPIAVGPGSAVRAGALVIEGEIVIRATRVGAEATTGRILRAMEQAQTGTTRLQRVADRAAAVFTPVVFALAALTLVLWWLAPEFMSRLEGSRLAHHEDASVLAQALRAAVAVLVVACPCAMGLATPTAIIVASGRAALRGILVKDAASLERAAQLSHLCLDKTGTLTLGRPAVRKVLAQDGASGADQESLRLAASLEQLSQHPFARAIVQHASSLGMDLIGPREFVSFPGRGVQGRLDGRLVLVGSASLLTQQGVWIESARTETNTVNGSMVWVAVDGRCIGVIELEDEVRPGTSAAMEELKRLGLRLSLVTGDAPHVARRVSSTVGIKEIHAALSPEEKLELVERLRASGGVVGFVGDGVNDGPALAAADVGLTLSTGTDVAAGAADVTLLVGDLRRIGELVRLARRTVRVIHQNLFWAVVYNLVTLPLAASGHIAPGTAAATMMLSSLSVVGNSLRLRRERVTSGARTVAAAE